MKKRCPVCKEVKSLEDFHNDRTRKDGHHGLCKNCLNESVTKYRNTEKGYLKMRYNSLNSEQRKSKCYFTFDEFVAAWEKHKSIYGMRSAWGPHHLPITMIYRGRSGGQKGEKNCGSNLSPDRLDSSKPYTIQNLIFIRNDENSRKKDTTYADCLTQIKLHEERFINMGAI